MEHLPFYYEVFPTYTSYTDLEKVADVIIDFSHHAGTADLVEYASRTLTKVVVATTGHTPEELVLIDELATKVGVVYAGNYSLGVNVLVELVKKASAKNTAEIGSTAAIRLLFTGPI